MPSQLGRLIRKARTSKGFGLREFAKLIKKSPAFITQLECDDEIPSVAEVTLTTIAKELELDADELMVLLHRTPSDVTPTSTLEVALYRQVKGMTKLEKEDLLNNLSTSRKR